jgi:hypothetical protein
MLEVGSVTIGGIGLYANFLRVAGRIRLRLSADEADRHDLFPGRVVSFGLPDNTSASVLIAAANPEPPFVWLDLESLTAETA